MFRLPHSLPRCCSSGSWELILSHEAPTTTEFRRSEKDWSSGNHGYYHQMFRCSEDVQNYMDTVKISNLTWDFYGKKTCVSSGNPEIHISSLTELHPQTAAIGDKLGISVPLSFAGRSTCRPVFFGAAQANDGFHPTKMKYSV